MPCDETRSASRADGAASARSPLMGYQVVVEKVVIQEKLVEVPVEKIVEKVKIVEVDVCLLVALSAHMAWIGICRPMHASLSRH